MRHSRESLGRAGGALAVVAVIAGLGAACGKPEPTPGSTPVASASASVDPVKAFLDDPQAELTPAIYESLLRSLAACKLQGKALAPRCPELQRFHRARRKKRSARKMLEYGRSLAGKFLTHPSAPVRFQAVRLHGPLIANDAAARERIVAAARHEKSPPVLVAMARVVGARHGKDASIRKLLLKLSEHDSANVRKEALSWFLTTFSEGVDGTFEKVLAHLEKDPSPRVRGYLCSRLYGSSDARAVPVLKRYLEAPGTSDELYSDCFAGLLKAWTGYPLPAKPRKDAYELTLKLLARKPRTKQRPPYRLHPLRAARTEFPERDKRGRAWAKASADWYEPKEVLIVLEDLARDDDASWRARSTALSAMAVLGTPRKVFESMMAKVKDAKAGDGVRIKRALERHLRTFDVRAGRLKRAARPGDAHRGRGHGPAKGSAAPHPEAVHPPH